MRKDECLFSVKTGKIVAPSPSEYVQKFLFAYRVYNLRYTWGWPWDPIDCARTIGRGGVTTYICKTKKLLLTLPMCYKNATLVFPRIYKN